MDRLISERPLYFTIKPIRFFLHFFTQDLYTTLNITKKAIWPIIAISTIVVATLQITLNEAMIQIATVHSGNILAQLVTDIFLTIAVHSALIAAAPLILKKFNKTTASYVTLAILLSIYSTLTTGMNAIAPVAVVITASVLIFYSWTRTRQIVQFLRKK